MASENYVYVNYPPLDIPFTVITGTEEDMELADIHSWQSETNSVMISGKSLVSIFLFLEIRLQLLTSFVKNYLFIQADQS